MGVKIARSEALNPGERASAFREMGKSDCELNLNPFCPMPADRPDFFQCISTAAPGRLAGAIAIASTGQKNAGLSVVDGDRTNLGSLLGGQASFKDRRILAVDARGNPDRPKKWVIATDPLNSQKPTCHNQYRLAHLDRSETLSLTCP